MRGRRLASVLAPWLVLAWLATPWSPASAGEAGAEAVRAAVLERLGVPAWHAAGFRGRGVNVAVLDSGFRGYRDHLGKALPERVTARSFRSDGDLEAKDSQHGILCGEVVHALAPEAELLFANWDPEKPNQFLDAVRWAKRQGARVVTCSVIMPTWSDGEGGGDVHRALAEVLGKGDRADDVLFFACAGNTALRHWAGPFRDGGDGWHAWAPDQLDDALHVWDGEKPSVELCWQTGARYEVSIRDATTGREVAHGLPTLTDGHGCAAARFDPAAGHSYTVRVRLTGGAPGSFHLYVLGGGLENGTARGSIPFPGDGAEVVTVAAVDDDGGRVMYSSCGPNGPAAKPDLSAVIPFPSLWRTRPFTGTSAAAPQAAGLAALLLSRHTDWPAARVREALAKAARRPDDMTEAEVGRGSIRMP
jgi:subtilisin family serine protease